ncbi:putative receptor-type tyrosine-protein phosphatase N2-like, partial [Scophthalmus maximus]
EYVLVPLLVCDSELKIFAVSTKPKHHLGTSALSQDAGDTFPRLFSKFAAATSHVCINIKVPDRFPSCLSGDFHFFHKRKHLENIQGDVNCRRSFSLMSMYLKKRHEAARRWSSITVNMHPPLFFVKVNAVVAEWIRRHIRFENPLERVSKDRIQKTNNSFNVDCPGNGSLPRLFRLTKWNNKSGIRHISPNPHHLMISSKTRPHPSTKFGGNGFRLFPCEQVAVCSVPAAMSLSPEQLQSVVERIDETVDVLSYTDQQVHDDANVSINAPRGLITASRSCCRLSSTKSFEMLLHLLSQHVAHASLLFVFLIIFLVLPNIKIISTHTILHMSSPLHLSRRPTQPIGRAAPLPDSPDYTRDILSSLLVSGRTWRRVVRLHLRQWFEFICVRQMSCRPCSPRLTPDPPPPPPPLLPLPQELCRQRMAVKPPAERPEPISSRINSVSSQFSDGGQALSPSARSSVSSWSEEPVHPNMDISTGHMILSYMEDHLKNKDRLEKEWEALCAYQAEPNGCTVGLKDGNAKKNRSAAVVAYDHSRITLKVENSQGNSDYINASPIMDHDPRNPAYIATQGPLPSTVADFWQMVWENGCVVIVMLTPLVESGAKQCYHYWPDEGSNLYHIYEVNLVSEHIWCDDFLVRSFYLKNMQTNETRTVTQFHFLTWLNQNVPETSRTLLDFRRKVNKCYRGRSCPIIVHCSDGAGRSGTYVLIDMVLNKMAKGAKEIDIAATLEHLRDQRSGMVQTKDQFEFALTAVAEEVNAILKALPQ